MIQLSFLRIRNVPVANGIGIISGIGMFMLFIAVTYYAEYPFPTGLGLTSFAAGLTLGPAAVLMLLVGPGIGRTVTRSGPKPAMVFGGVIAIIASVLFIFYGTTATNVTFDMAVAMVGIV